MDKVEAGEEIKSESIADPEDEDEDYVIPDEKPK